MVQPGGSGAGPANPIFQGASADGSVVFFTDSRKLTAGASPAGRDLYRCEIPLGSPASACASLTDVSAPLPGSGESAEVQGIVSALGEDGNTAYFVAEGVLDTAPNQLGDFAVAGEPNLYLWREGQDARFIATLAGGGSSDWGGNQPNGVVVDGKLFASASPSGRYFAFMSQRSLTGQENRDAASGEPVQEVFRYDAAADRLDCLSCHPSGAAPRGQGGENTFALGRPLVDRTGVWDQQAVAALLPAPTVKNAVSDLSFYRSRAILDNGRVFFNAFDSLVPADSNGQWDVYQYEPFGAGDCTVSSGGAATVRSAGGCVSLLSSGTAQEEAGFLDASASGDDVFFLTPARLSVTDVDAELDVYDARVDGVTASLAPSGECLGEACQPAAAAPNDPTPGTATLNGPGDPKSNPSRRCPKGKRRVRRHGKVRCVRRKYRQGQRHHRRAGQDRRAAR